MGAFAYHVVTVTRDRLPLLRGDLATRAIAELARVAEATSFDVMAYVVMPDHVHMLVNGIGDSSDLIRFVQRFKQRLGFEHKRATGAQLWQPSFFDHALRKAEDAQAIAEYIVGNPVRAGLARSVEGWPFVGGSLVATTPRRS